MGITLISISKLDIAGYAALFRDKRCQIFDARKKKLGEILLNKGLYCLKYSRCIFAGLAKASDPLTMEEIHVRLGHIAPAAIRAMLKDGTITGLTLDEAHPTMGACDSCEYAKTTRKPIGKERDPPRHENLGDKVHTDLWGPSLFKCLVTANIMFHLQTTTRATLPCTYRKRKRRRLHPISHIRPGYLPNLT